jgi:glycosyltransferase involved in cell wall biosynthesis
MLKVPVIAVVVPTHERAERLPRLVTALEQQDCLEPFEVVVVDDASRDRTWSQLQDLATSSQVPLRPIRLDQNSGPARARNVGWRSSSASIIAFTDDDCKPGPGWLSQLVAGFADADIVQGCTVPGADLEPNGAFTRTMSVASESGLFETCNIAYRRELLERLDGFDEAFRYPYGEDVELGWRAKVAGARTVFRATAVVEHDVTHQTLSGFIADLRRLDGAAMVAKRHPALRDYFYQGIFYRRSHALALLAIAGGALSLTRPAGLQRVLAVLALSSPWILQRSRGHRLTAMPRLLASDLAEMAFLAVASARRRTIVL